MTIVNGGWSLVIFRLGEAFILFYMVRDPSRFFLEDRILYYLGHLASVKLV